MANWKTYRIVDVVSDIDEEKFVLPVIQRSLVWTEEKMQLLFDTLLKGDSFGGIMVIEEEKNSKPLFNYRQFTRDGNFIPSIQVDNLKQLQMFVIDGQQRLQSFYIGLKGTINGKSLYFDFFSDYTSEYEFKFEKDQNTLPKSSKEIVDRTVNEHFWFPVKDLLRKLKDTNDEEQVSEEIIKNSNIDDTTKKNHITKNIKAFYKNVITSEALGISKVVVNKSFKEIDNRQRIVELFRRLNDGGTKLSSFDLVASILKGFSWEMEGFLREMLETYEDIGLSQENLIKLIFLLQDNTKKEMAAIEASDAEFAITNRERIKVTLKALKDFLDCSKTYDYYKEGNRSFIPLFFIAYHLFHKDIENNKLFDFFSDYETKNDEFLSMQSWMFNSLINGVFKSKGAGWVPYKTGVRKILETLKNHKNKSFPKNELFQIYLNHPITFTPNYTINNLDQLENSFVFYLMYDRAKATRTNDIDHIMPKNILENKKYDWQKINSIKNFQLLDYGTNRGVKNGKPFAEWVNNPEYVKEKSTYLKIHLIPEDENLWNEDNFEQFINDRAELLLQKIKEFV